MIKSQRFFTSGEVQRLVGIAQHTLSYWDQSSVVHPHGRLAKGKGSRRLYTTLDVVQLKIIRRLREAGVSLQKIRWAFGSVAEWPDEPVPLAELVVLADGKRILVKRSDDLIIDPVARQFALHLPVAELVAEVRDDVVPLPFADRAARRPATSVGGQQP